MWVLRSNVADVMVKHTPKVVFLYVITLRTKINTELPALAVLDISLIEQCRSDNNYYFNNYFGMTVKLTANGT